MFQAKMNIVTEDNSNDRVIEIRYSPTSLNLEDREAEAFVDAALVVGKTIQVIKTVDSNNPSVTLVRLKVV